MFRIVAWTDEKFGSPALAKKSSGSRFLNTSWGRRLELNLVLPSRDSWAKPLFDSSLRLHEVFKNIDCWRRLRLRHTGNRRGTWIKLDDNGCYFLGLGARHFCLFALYRAVRLFFLSLHHRTVAPVESHKTNPRFRMNWSILTFSPQSGDRWFESSTETFFHLKCSRHFILARPLHFKESKQFRYCVRNF